MSANIINHLAQSAEQNANALSAQEMAQREALARQHGYPSYEAMINFERQRSRRDRGPQTASRGSPRLEDALPALENMHPRAIFERIQEALAGVNGK